MSLKDLIADVNVNEICEHIETETLSEWVNAWQETAISALRPVSREQVEKVWRGVWKHYLPPLGAGNIQCRCTKCGRTPDVETPFCAWCGAPMTDEAVEMVMEKINNMEEMTNEH